jgi:hypothetical protein
VDITLNKKNMITYNVSEKCDLTCNISFLFDVMICIFLFRLSNETYTLCLSHYNDLDA